MALKPVHPKVKAAGLVALVAGVIEALLNAYSVGVPVAVYAAVNALAPLVGAYLKSSDWSQTVAK